MLLTNYSQACFLQNKRSGYKMDIAL
jgi:hypothetical protein